jgi:hypothetical protein
MGALRNEWSQAKGFGEDGPLPADRIKSGFAAGTYGWDLAGEDSGRELKIAGAYGATRNSHQPQTNSQSKETASVKI